MPQLWSINGIAEELQVDRRRVSRTMKEVPRDGKKGRYDAWYMATAVEAIFLQEQAGGTEPEINPENMHPKDRRDWYEGEKTRLNLEQTAKTLLVGEEVRRTAAVAFQAIIGPFEALPDLLERDCGADPDMVVLAENIVDRVRQDAYERLLERLFDDE